MDLSIIIPIYNVEEYLRECLDSIYKIKGIKKEVILVNDGSTDNSQDIIDEYKKLYDQETVVIVQKNKGLSGARNSGLDVATGKYISFIDSDDFIDNDKFVSFFKECTRLDLEIAAGDLKYYCNNEAYRTKSMKKRSEKLKSLPICQGLEYGEICLEPKLDSIRVEVWVNLYKNEFLKSHNLKFREGLLHEDTLFMYQAIAKAKKVKYIPYDFYYYRMREGSIMKTQSYKNYVHKLYIAKELQEIKEKENINLKSWDTIITALYFGAVKAYKIKNMELYRKIKKGNKLTIKSRIKKILLNIYHISANDIEIDIKCS